MRTFLWIIATTLAAFAALHLGGPEAIREQLGGWAPFVTLPAHIAAVAGPLAGDELFGLANGTLYGLWMGSVLSWAAWFSGSLMIFGSGGSEISGLLVLTKGKVENSCWSII